MCVHVLTMTLSLRNVGNSLPNFQQQPLPLFPSALQRKTRRHKGHKDINAYVVIFFKVESEKLTLV